MSSLDLSPACLAEIGIMDTETKTSEQSLFRQVMELRDVHLLAAFVLCYVGAEVTLGGTCPHSGRPTTSDLYDELRLQDGL